jgi:hypothetical protein
MAQEVGAELPPVRQLGGLRSFVAGSVAEEARTRGFAAPAFAGCAFVDGGYCLSTLGTGTAEVKKLASPW